MSADQIRPRSGRRRAVHVVGTIFGCLIFVPLAISGITTMVGGPVNLSADSGSVERILTGGYLVFIGSCMAVGLIVDLITNERVFFAPTPPLQKTDAVTDERLIPWVD